MALRGTLTHRKTRRLAQLLDIDQCAALGILESLWHVTAEHHNDGGIGRMGNQDIADEMYYRADADKLVKALVKSGWLDQAENSVEKGRLFVHDWHLHADDSVNAKLIQWTKCYANGEPPRLRKLSVEARVRVADKFLKRFGPFIGQKMLSVRTDAEVAHDAHDAHIQKPEACIQSPESSIQKPEELKDICSPAVAAKPKTTRPTPMGTRLPDETLPDKWGEWSKEKLGWAAEHSLVTFDDFRDYWLAAAGEKARKADWFATWRTWCRRERDPPKFSQLGGKPKSLGSELPNPWIEKAQRDEEARKQHGH